MAIFMENAMIRNCLSKTEEQKFLLLVGKSPRIGMSPSWAQICPQDHVVRESCFAGHLSHMPDNHLTPSADSLQNFTTFSCIGSKIFSNFWSSDLKIWLPSQAPSLHSVNPADIASEQRDGSHKSQGWHDGVKRKRGGISIISAHQRFWGISKGFVSRRAPLHSKEKSIFP